MIQNSIKKLKSNIPYTEKLEIARKMQSFTNFSGKDSLLLDWIVPTMYKHSSVEYWQFLLELLSETPTTISIANLISNNIATADKELQDIVYRCFQFTKHTFSSEQLLGLSEKVVLGDVAIEYVKDIIHVSHAAQLQSTNQKKVFIFLVQKLLIPFAKVEQDIPGLLSKSFSELLFHRDHLLEFPSVINQEVVASSASTKKKDLTSYPKHFFELLNGLEEPDFVLLSYLDIALLSFSQKIRNQHQSCLFFVHLQTSLISLFEKSSIDGKVLIIKAITSLLLVLKDQMLYRPSNDDQSRRIFESFKSLYSIFHSWIQIPQTVGILLKAIQLLLVLDFKIIGDDLEFLWNYVLTPNDQDRTAAMELFLELMDSYVKLRQVPAMLSSLFDTIRERNLNESSCILLDSKVLDHFDHHISTMLPAQSFEIFSEIKTELVENYNDTQTHKTKKSKTRGKSFVSSVTVSTLFIHMIENIQVLESRKTFFDEFVCDFYDSYIDQVFIKAMEKRKHFIRDVVVPALRMHLVCLQASDEYWKKHCSIASLVDKFHKMSPFDKYPVAGALLVEISCFCLDKMIALGLEESSEVLQLVEQIWKFQLVPEITNKIIKSHIWTLDRLSTPEQVRQFLKEWIKVVSKGDKQELEDVRNSAVFLEVPSIRLQFLHSFYSVLYATLKEAPTISSLLKPLHKQDSKSWNEGLAKRIEYQGEAMESKELKRIHELVKLLEIFPVEYFSHSERETLQWVLYLLERLVHQSKFRLGLLRKLFVQVCQKREDRLVVFYSFDLLKWLIDSVKHDVPDSLEEYTQPLVSLVTKKLFERIGSPLLKDGEIKSNDYAEMFLDYIIQCASHGRGEVLLPFIGSIFHYIKEKSSNDSKNYLFQTKIHQIAKVVLKNIQCFDEKTAYSIADGLLYWKHQEFPETLPTLTNEISDIFAKNAGWKARDVMLRLKWVMPNHVIQQEELHSWFAILWPVFTPESFEPVISNFIQKGGADNFNTLLDMHLIQLKEILKELRNGRYGDFSHGTLTCTRILVQNCLSAWKSTLATKWSQLINLLSQVCLVTKLFDPIVVCSEILLVMIKTLSYELKVSQVSLIFNCLTNLQVNQELVLNAEDSAKLFDLTYQLLYGIIRYRREEMLKLIPSFLTHVSVLVDCFSIPDPRKVHDRQFVSNPFFALNGWLPKENSAKLISRLLFQMTQRPMSSADTQKLEVVKPFAKHVPFFIIRLLYLPANTKRNMGEEWKLSMYACLDACDDFGRNMVLAGLDGNLQSLRPIYKNIVSDWEREHRYHGKA